VGITILSGSATISTTEYWLASGSTTQTPQTTDCSLQVWLDFTSIPNNTTVYEWEVVERINAGSINTILTGRVSGLQSDCLVITGLVVGDGWEVGVKKISGTDTTVRWSLRLIT
jgi:hypothetical protein